MTDEITDQVIVEARVVQTDTEPSIKIFTVEITKPDKGCWPETFGSVALLKAFLLGVSISLTMEGYYVTGMTWAIPEQWQEPSGKRWTITRGKLVKDEDLDSEDNVIPPI